MPPLILHVDMDAFFASVEMRSDPRLRNRPLVVGGGPGKRGVVTTASYPARKFGVRSGMALAEALRLCPRLLVIPVTPSKYVDESRRILALLDRFSPRVEAASIDEAYLEIPAAPGGAWPAVASRWGHRIQHAVLEERRLSCSVGAAVNKLQAKMASSLQKPAGVCVVTPERFLRIFGERPVSVISGVGPRTTEVLERLGVSTVGELAAADREALRGSFGEWSGILIEHARGRDVRELLASGEEPLPRSASHETTFAQDVSEPRVLRATVWRLADRVARRLRLYRLEARTACVRFKVGRRRYSRQRVLPEPTAEPRLLALTAWLLLEDARKGRALRLVGVAGMGLLRAVSADPLLVEDRRRRAVMLCSDRLRDRYGERTILPAASFCRREGE